MTRPIYTISVSKIEALHKWLHRQTEDNESYNNEANFLATLQGKFVQIDHAKYGDCFHAIVEGTAKLFDYVADANTPQQKVIAVYQYKEVMIPHLQGLHAAKYSYDHPLMTKEFPVNKLYHTRNFDIIVTGRVDGLEGNLIRDTKTKYSSPDMQLDYIDSQQWRIYLDILMMDRFVFDIFQISGFKTIADCLKARIKPLEPLYLQRYPDMPEDVETAVQELADYIEAKNLFEYITIPQISPVAVQYGIYKDLKWSDSTTLNFGKHRGKTLAEVPQYLTWLYYNKPLPAQLKQYIISKKLI